MKIGSKQHILDTAGFAHFVLPIDCKGDLSHLQVALRLPVVLEVSGALVASLPGGGSGCQRLRHMFLFEQTVGPTILMTIATHLLSPGLMQTSAGCHDMLDQG